MQNYFSIQLLRVVKSSLWLTSKKNSKNYATIHPIPNLLYEFCACDRQLRTKGGNQY